MAELTARGLNEELGIEIIDGYELALESEDLEKGRTEAERLDHELLKGVGFHLTREPRSATEPGAAEDCEAEDAR